MPLEDLYGGRQPSRPQAEESMIRQMVEVTTASIKRGEAVVIHCQGGTGRTGTILGATLRQLGYGWKPVHEAMMEVNQLRGRHGRGWPESSWQESLVRDWLTEAEGGPA